MNVRTGNYFYTIGIKFYKKIRRLFYGTLTCISPKLNTKIRYMEMFHKPLPIDNPKTFVDKLLWLKLNNYNQNPLVARCADKYAVRGYVKECGCEIILNEIYGVYDSIDDINWDELPQKFALKWNFGAGMNVICKDKSSLDIKNVTKKMKKWEKNKYWLSHAEMQYKHIEKKIICEAYLEDDKYDVIPDYKVYCFNGKPMAIFVMLGRGGQVSAQFYDTEWNKLENTEKYKSVVEEVRKPECLQEMLEVARKLSEKFPFVRCDFYLVKGKLYFGELTFTPAGGFYPSQTNINGRDMADYITLEEYKK